jgi:hypothetical protein
MIPAVALLDANVLYPAPLRDLLLQLAFNGLYQARWSAEIDDEWKRNLLAARPELAERIDRTHAVMNAPSRMRSWGITCARAPCHGLGRSDGSILIRILRLVAFIGFVWYGCHLRER